MATSTIYNLKNITSINTIAEIFLLFYLCYSIFNKIYSFLLSSERHMYVVSHAVSHPFQI